MNCKITEQQTRQIMRLDGDVTMYIPASTVNTLHNNMSVLLCILYKVKSIVQLTAS